MVNFFSVNAIMVNIGNYPLSYIEFVGTILYFFSVFLISRKNMLTWPIGIVSVILYGILFYQIQLYSDMMEQVYYLVISVIGWLMWQKKKNETNDIPTAWGSFKVIAISIAVTALSTLALTYCVSHFHIWLPAIFPEPAAFPFLDALTTVMSFVAMYLTTMRKNEGWIYWILVNVIGIWLYWIKDVKFISIQYVFLLGMAIYGLANWIRKNIRHRLPPNIAIRK
jgi:nicotinamide mononucleotide transporter